MTITYLKTVGFIDELGRRHIAVDIDGAGPPIYVLSDEDHAAADFAARRAEKFAASEAGA